MNEINAVRVCFYCYFKFHFFIQDSRQQIVKNFDACLVCSLFHDNLATGLCRQYLLLVLTLSQLEWSKKYHTAIKRKINKYTIADFQWILSHKTLEQVFDGNDVNKIFNTFLNIFL